MIEINPTCTYKDLSDFMHARYRKQVVERALAFYAKAHSDSRAQLEVALRHTVKVAKHRNPLTAPLDELLDPVTNAFRKHDDVIRAVIALWMETQAGLRSKAEAFLMNQGLPVTHTLPLDSFPQTWTKAEMMELTQQFDAAEPGYSFDDIALMLCCLLGRGPSSRSLTSILDELEDADTEEGTPPAELPLQPDDATDGNGSEPDDETLPTSPAPGIEMQRTPLAEEEAPSEEDMVPPVEAPDEFLPAELEENSDATPKAEATSSALPLDGSPAAADSAESEPTEDTLPQKIEDSWAHPVEAATEQDTLREAYQSLFDKLDLARELLRKGAFDGIVVWLDQFREQVTQTASAFAEVRHRLISQLADLQQAIDAAVATGDAAPFLAEVEDLRRALAGDPLAQYDAIAKADDAHRTLTAYLVRLQEAREAVTAGIAALEDKLELARLWQVSNTQWQATLRRQPEPGAPLAILEEAASRLVQTQQQILEAVHQARRDLVNSQQSRCQDIQTKLDLVTEKTGRAEILAEFATVKAALETELDDNILLAIPDRLDVVQAWAITPDVDAELTQAATTYATSADQFIFEYLLDLLWSRDRQAEAFMIFTMALRAGRWQSGAKLPENGLSHYFTGLQAVIPPEQLVSAAMELCAGGLLANTVGWERPEEKLAMLMLYAAGLSARPGALPAEDLWLFRDTTAAPDDSQWVRLAERLMQGDQPDILRKEQTDFSSITELESRLEEEFRREGGKYAHLAGAGSETLVKMERQTLMPYLEEFWRDLRHKSPGQRDWPKLKKEVEDLDPAEMLAKACREEGVPEINPFFEKEYRKRLDLLVDLLRKYAQQRQQQHWLTLNPPITWEGLEAELGAFGPTIGAPLATVVEAVLREARSAQDAPISAWQATEEALEQRLAHILLTDAKLRYPLSPAVAWLGRTSTQTGGTWGEWLDTAIQGLALPLALSRIIATYQEAKLPLLALAVAEAGGQAGAVRQTNKLLDRLQQEIAECETHLQNLGNASSVQEQAWLREGRFGLALSQMESRIKHLEAEKKLEEQRQQDALRQLYRDVSELEPVVAEFEQMPEATRMEAFAALADVRTVSLGKQGYRLTAAQDVLKEIRRLLAYPGATAEGLAQQMERLRTTTPPRQIYSSDAMGQKQIPSVAAMARALRDGDLAQLGLRAGALSDKQREDRAEMLELWQRVATVPVESELSADDIAAMQRFASLLSFTTGMYMQLGSPGDITWATRPIPVFETRLKWPKTAALKRGVALVFITGETLTRRQLRTLDGMLQDQHWLREGWFVVLLAPLAADTVGDWVRRNRPNDPIAIIDGKTLQEITLSTDNPTATGRLRRALLRVAGPARFDVFKFENMVDSDQDIFVGRKDWQIRLVDSEQSHAVYGGRRIGKSSLLNAVGKELRTRGVRTAYVSLEGVEIREREGLSICDEILQKLGIGQTCSSFGDFKTKMTGFFVSEPTARVTILLDEVDKYINACSKAGQAHKLIHTLRGLYQEQHGRCRFIIAGFIELWRQLNIKGDIAGQDSPWFNFLQDNGPLEGLLESDARAIVTQGFQEILGITLVPSGIATEVIERTTTHPAFVQQFCAQLHIHLHTLQSDRLTLEDIKAVFKDRKEKNFLEFVHATLRPNLNPLPRLIVLLLAAERTEKFTVNDIKMIAQSYDSNQVLGSLADRQWNDSMDELRITSVIRRAQSANTYQFSVPSYPVILREFEEANQNVIIELIHDIASKAKS